MRKMKPDSRKKIAERIVKFFTVIGGISAVIMFLTFMHKTTYQLWESTADRESFTIAAILISVAGLLLTIIAAIFDSKKAE